MRLQFDHLLVSCVISWTCSIGLAPSACPQTLTDRQIADARETPTAETANGENGQSGNTGAKAAAPATQAPAPRPAEQRYPRKIKTKFALAG